MLVEGLCSHQALHALLTWYMRHQPLHTLYFLPCPLPREPTEARVQVSSGELYLSHAGTKQLASPKG